MKKGLPLEAILHPPAKIHGPYLKASSPAPRSPFSLKKTA